MKLIQIFLNPALLMLVGLALLYFLRSTKLYRRIRFSGTLFVIFLSFQWLLYNMTYSERYPGYIFSLDVLRMPQWVDSFAIFFGVLLIVRLLDFLLFARHEGAKTEKRISVLVRDMAIFIILLVVILFILKSQFGIKPTALIATSAVLSAIIGLALQDVLANILSGVSLHIEKPFEVKDWIYVNGMEGRVVEVNWRATRIITHSAELVVIPNSLIAKDNIINYSKPSKIHAVSDKIGLPYDASPNKVKEILVNSILSIDGVSKNPKPQLRLIEYGDFAIKYEIRYWISERLKWQDIMDAVMTQAWYALHRNRIIIPFPIRNVYLHDAGQIELKRNASELSSIKNMIKSTELFRSLSDDQISVCASGVKKSAYSRNEKLVTQGDEGDDLFIISKGTVKVFIDGENHQLENVAELTEKEFFGELSLLTGESRSATVIANDDVEVLIIDKACIASLLEQNPDIVVKLSQVLTEREKQREHVRERSRKDNESEESQTKTLIKKISRYFGI
ncbi:MAG: mechanosensitive ion channel family protein [Candidatus Theseobacter exili]|nr:mechanosensitive ion channel family protein [Candidatus Theseobacter exili]